MQPRTGLGCSISVISLQKLKTFLEQPKYNHSRFPCSPQFQHQGFPYQHHDTRNIDENLSGNVDSSQLPNIFSNHDSSNRVPVNNTNHGGGPPMGQPGPPQGVASKKGMLPMGPQHEPGNMSLAPPTKMSPSPHQNPNDLNPSANGSTGRKYQCKMCPQIFGSKADLQLHTQIHMRDAKPYKCSQCSKTFANSSYLSQHTRIHLGIKPYRCEICHRKFTQLSHLQQHIRTHTGDKPYKCRYPNCNKAFSQLSNLQSHSRCHQTDKPFKCNSCYKCFSDEPSLLEHIPKHKESKHLKTHICQFCGKSYTQETYLAKHMQKHADRLEKHGMLNSFVLPASIAAAAGVQQLQPDILWQKAIQQAKVVDNVTTVSDGGPNSSVAAMAAVVASQRQAMDTNASVQQQQQNQQEGAMNSCNNDQLDDGMVAGGLSAQDVFDPQPQQQHQQQQQQPTSSASSSGVKSTSAFTPIQSGLLSATASNQLNLSSSPRTYFSYDALNFGKSTAESPKQSSFPNQLISLKQIRSYASMPSMSGIDHPISLKNKGPN